MEEKRDPPSAWAPLRQPLFRALWLATVASTVGTWMQDVGAAWLMTTLAPSPVMVALVQTAAMLPMCLLALPAGAVADIVDRRRLLLFTQGWMLLSAAALGGLTLAGATSPWVLLLLTFTLGLGASLNAPAWQAIVPELVPGADMPAAVTLNSVAVNLARSIGPALGGVIVSLAGAGVNFLLNAASFLGVMVVLYRWRREPRESSLPAERFVEALRAGIRYIRQARELQAVLVRAAAFILCGCAPWALLPLLARQDLRVGPAGYGALLACLGAGAVAGAVVMPRFKRRASIDAVAAAATAVFAAVAFALATIHQFDVLCGVMFVGGGAWLTVLSSLNVSAQASVSGWVRARALSVYLLIFFGGMAGGSALWGFIAEHVGLSPALLGSGAGLVAGLAVVPRFPLRMGEGLDLTPSMHWPAPQVAGEVELDRGPVMVAIEYRIDRARAKEFAEAMRTMCRIRRRDGAFAWGLYSDATDPQRFVEFFTVESWGEHLRQHERGTVADLEVQKRVYSFLVDMERPIVSHYIAEEPTA
jgi:MFS family permease